MWPAGCRVAWTPAAIARRSPNGSGSNSRSAFSTSAVSYNGSGWACLEKPFSAA